MTLYNVEIAIYVLKTAFQPKLSSGTVGLSSRVSVQGVKSFGGHFACLCRGFDFYGVNIFLSFFKNKREILLHFSSFYNEKSSKRAK